MGRLIFTYIFLLFLVACSSKEIHKDNPKIISQLQISADITYAINMLRNAYSGGRFQDPQIFQNVLREMQALSKQESQIQKDFCNNIQKILEKLPDNHLYAALPRPKGRFRPCGDVLERFSIAKSSVGKNLQTNKNLRWTLTSKMTSKFKKTMILAISSFSGGSNLHGPLWKGLVDTAQILGHEPYFIVDLRGNGGGSDPVVYEWIKYLFNGKKRISGVQWRIQTSEKFEIRKNFWKQKLKRATNKLQINFYKKEIKKASEQQLKAQNGKLARWKKIDFGNLTGKASKTYEGTIYVLTDKITGSAAEGMVEWLDSIFKTVKIGDNTSGSTHFGNVGMAILPYSNILIQIGTSFDTTRYGFIEQKGITPDIKLMPGQDALEIALDEIDKTFP